MSSTPSLLAECALPGEENAVPRMNLVKAAKYRAAAAHVTDYDEYIKEDTAIDFEYRGRVEAEQIQQGTVDLAGDAAESMFARCEKFTNDFPGSRHAAAVAEAKEKARKKWYEHRLGVARERATKSQPSFQEAREAFLVCLRVPGYANDQTAIDGAVQVEKAWFADRMTDADMVASRHPVDFPAARIKYLDCRKVPGYGGSEEAGAKVDVAVRSLEGRWDETEYVSLRALPPAVSSAIQLRDAKAAAAEYMSPKRKVISMKKAVEQYLRDVQAVERKGFSVTLTLPEIFIPYASNLISSERPVIVVQFRVAGNDGNDYDYTGRYYRGFGSGQLNTQITLEKVEIGSSPKAKMRLSIGNHARGGAVEDTRWLYKNIDLHLNDVFQGSGTLPVSLWEGTEETRVVGELKWSFDQPDQIRFQLPAYEP